MWKNADPDLPHLGEARAMRARISRGREHPRADLEPLRV
jgi:hypothetical protein